ncbi:MAG: efflux RND transporter periplasmic adaptor subunit [Anaerolineales bacterium]|nr:efflux RND transporter periplasmic adaptor subunit [Anaerolineales bacterium]
MKKKTFVFVSLMVVLSMALSACGALGGAQVTDLKASGTIAAREVNVAPQIGGQVVSVSVEEGAQVKSGDELFRLDDSLFKAQRAQAEAAIKLAESAVSSAKAQYDLVLNGAHLQDQQNRISNWNASQPSQFDLPVWYFDKDEKLASAQVEMESAAAELDKEKANLEKVLTNVASQEFLDTEKKVADAQAAFVIADQVLSQAKSAQDNEDLQNFAQDQYDAAENELKSAQTDYARLLTTQGTKDVLEARARVKVTQERYDSALDYYNSFLSGDQSLQVKAAEAGVQQAEAAQAQAQAALATLDVQIEKTVIRAPMDGVVLIRNLEVGETAAPGGVVMVIGQLAEVELVVYIPETEYGKVNLGDQVSISVDSFPGETFSGTVVHISDKAEFTPRNVQTIEGRRATVYGIKISVPNPDLKLKPGMPADVTFTNNQ